MKQTYSALRRWIPVGYTEFAPPVGTESIVECLWTSRAEESVAASIHPDGCVDLLLRAGSRGARIDIVGAMSHAHLTESRAGELLVGVRFRPGQSAAVLGGGIDQFTDLTVPLAARWGCRSETFSRDVLDAEHPDALIPLLLSLAQGAGDDSGSIQAGIDALVLSQGRLDIVAASEHAALRPRQFRRQCLERTGLTPKRLSRVLRFRAATASLREQPFRTMAVIALESGYSDQAHMIREFRAICGQLPTAFRAIPAA
jgi:AraC-like DNA-binding protein